MSTIKILVPKEGGHLVIEAHKDHDLGIYIGKVVRQVIVRSEKPQEASKPAAPAKAPAKRAKSKRKSPVKGYEAILKWRRSKEVRTAPYMDVAAQFLDFLGKEGLSDCRLNEAWPRFLAKMGRQDHTGLRYRVAVHLERQKKLSIGYKPTEPNHITLGLTQ